MMTDRKELEGAIQNEVERRQFSLMNDELFGYVFGSDERRDITADFLGAALEDSLGHGITGVSFMPPREIPVLRDRELVSRFAARCELGEEVHAFAELQLVNYLEWRELPLACCAEMMSAQPEYDIHPVATVSILSYSLFGNGDWRSDYYFRNVETGHILDKGLGMHFLEVPKFAKAETKPVIEMTKLERWMAFFSDCLNDVEKNELAKLEPAIGRADAAAEEFFNDGENVSRYIDREIGLRLFRAAMQDVKKQVKDRGEQSPIRTDLK